MKPKDASPFEEERINSNMFLYNGGWDLKDRKKGLYHFKEQFTIKPGVDPQKALENARDALVYIQIQNQVIQKIDLTTLKSYPLNITYPREWYDMEYRFSLLSEVLTMNMNKNEVTKTLRSKYQEMHKADSKELIWRFDLDANDDYEFNENTYKIDMESIRNRELKKQIFIFWNENETIKEITPPI
jgi:hypothetical protein